MSFEIDQKLLQHAFILGVFIYSVFIYEFVNIFDNVYLCDFLVFFGIFSLFYLSYFI